MDKVRTLENIEAVEKETRAFECPNCSAHLQFMVRVNVFGVKESMTGEEVSVRDGRPLPPAPTPAAPNGNGGSPAQARLVEAMKADGTFEAFTKTVDATLPAGRPKNVEKFFLTFLETCTPIAVPSSVLRKIIGELKTMGEPEGFITVYSAQQVALVTVDGEPKLFTPVRLLRGERVRLSANAQVRLRIRAKEESIEHWIRTRNGYVVGRGELFNELARKRPGEFANTGV